MEMSFIIQIVTTVTTILFGFIALYLKSRSEIYGKASEFIAKAEDDYKDTVNAGGKKFEFVVEQLYSIVPIPFKPFLNKEVIGTIVQYTFDYIQKYAVAQLDKIGKETK